VAGVLCALMCACAAAEVQLDLLTQCGDVAKVAKYVKDGNATSLGNCRQPKGGTERAIYAKVGGAQAGLCFLDEPPAGMLDGFSCVGEHSDSSDSLVCFRSTSKSDLSQYKKDYLVLSATAEKANQYKVEASKCGVTNGSTLSASRTTMPMLMVLISRFEFGFTSRIGKGRTTDAMIQHGYASTDPSLEGVPGALEYVYVLFTDGSKPIRDESVTVGAWNLSTGDMSEMDDAMNAMLKKAKGPTRVAVASQSFDFKRRDDAKPATASKTALLNRLQSSVAKRFAIEGFRDIGDEELEGSTGMTRKELVQNAAKGLPYGQQYMLPMTLSENATLMLMVKEAGAACTSEGKGALVAYSIMTTGIPEVESDFGGMLVQIMGMGTCSRLTRSSTRTYLDGLERDVEKSLQAELKRW
jgi:hypothetical protein